MTPATLLLELFTEELPPKALRSLGAAFADGLAKALRDDGFLTDTSEAVAYATPRRLAVSITHVLAKAREVELIERLLPRSVA